MVKGTAAKGRDVTTRQTKWRTASFAFLFICALVALLAFAGMASAEDAPTSALDEPTLTSDTATYAPGDTVTLSGSGWLLGQTVHVRVDDNAGDAWEYETDVFVAFDGTLSATLDLPSIAAGFGAVATGLGSATTSFTTAFAAAAAPPTIVSDKADYAPQELVTLTGCRLVGRRKRPSRGQRRRGADVEPQRRCRRRRGRRTLLRV